MFLVVLINSFLHFSLTQATDVDGFVFRGEFFVLAVTDPITLCIIIGQSSYREIQLVHMKVETLFHSWWGTNSSRRATRLYLTSRSTLPLYQE